MRYTAEASLSTRDHANATVIRSVGAMKCTGQLLDYIKVIEEDKNCSVPASCVINFGKPAGNGLSKLQELVIGHRRSAGASPSWMEPASKPNTSTGFDLSQTCADQCRYDAEEWKLLEAVIDAATTARQNFQYARSENRLRDETKKILDGKKLKYGGCAQHSTRSHLSALLTTKHAAATAPGRR